VNQRYEKEFMKIYFKQKNEKKIQTQKWRKLKQKLKKFETKKWKNLKQQNGKKFTLSFIENLMFEAPSSHLHMERRGGSTILTREQE